MCRLHHRRFGYHRGLHALINAGIKADGLAAFRRDLKKIDPELQKQLRVDLLAVGQLIARQVAGQVPKVSGRAAASIRAGVSGNSAYVQGGKATVPYYGWLDFGSRRPIEGRPRSVGPWKNSGPGPQRGRFIYPTITRNRQVIKDKATSAFDKAADAALQKVY